MMDLGGIKERVSNARSCAEGIMSGDIDNYDGADGAREVLELCDIIDSLIKVLEGEGINNDEG
jgi:hypothetical protein